MPPRYAATDAQAYEQSMGRWSARLAVPFAAFAAPAAGRLADIGCGTGSLSLALAAPGRRIAGIDLSPAFVAQARARLPAGHRLGLTVGDAAALPFAAGTFDAALSLLVLNFLPDPQRAAAEMARITRPGGVVAACVWDFRGGLTFMRVFADTAATLDPSGEDFRARQFANPLTGPGELATAWHSLGLAEVTEAALTIRMEFAGFDDYWGPWLGGQGVIGAYVMGLDAARRDRLATHLRRAYCAGGPDGPRSFAATAWAVRGRKP